MCLLVDYRGLYYLSCIMLYHVLSCCILISVVGRFCFFFNYCDPGKLIGWVGFVSKKCFKLFFLICCLIYFIFLCLLWWSSIVSKCCLEKCLFQLFQFIFQNHSLLSFSFPLLILFSFFLLAPFFWNSQKCTISQNIGCLIKTQLKNSTQTYSNNFSRESTLILNSVFVVVVLYCVQFFFLEVNIFQNHSLLSFSFPLLIILFTFLAPFFLNSQNALLKPN